MRIAITGPISDRNLGDYGMLLNNLYDLGSDIKYTIFTYNKSFLETAVKLYLSDFDIKIVEVKFDKFEGEKSFYHKLKEIRRNVLGIKKKWFPTPLELLNRCSNLTEIKNELQKCERILINGGGYFNELWFRWKRRDDLFIILIPLLCASKLNLEIKFTANGFGPFDESSHFYTMIFSELRNVTYVSRDDLHSPTYLRNIGVNHQILQLPDDLYIQNKKLHETVDISELEQGKYIILETYGNRKTLPIKEIAKFIDEMYKAHGLRTVFMPFEPEVELFNAIKSKCSLDAVSYYQNNDHLSLVSAIAVIKKSEMVICNRYHALVLSVSNKIPVVNVLKPIGDLRYYYNKNVGFLNKAFEDIEFDSSVFLKDSYTNMLLSIIKDYTTIKSIQNGLYDDVNFEANKEKLMLEREEYFKKLQVK